MFSCPSLEGAEIIDDWSPETKDYVRAAGHWSERLFPRDIMSYAPSLLITKITLAAIADSAWYKVNINTADFSPLIMPLARGCDVATRSCHDVIADAANYHDAKNLSILPFCVDKPDKPIVSAVESRNNTPLFVVHADSAVLRMIHWYIVQYRICFQPRCSPDGSLMADCISRASWDNEGCPLDDALWILLQLC